MRHNVFIQVNFLKTEIVLWLLPHSCTCRVIAIHRDCCLRNGNRNTKLEMAMETATQIKTPVWNMKAPSLPLLLIGLEVFVSSGSWIGRKCLSHACLSFLFNLMECSCKLCYDYHTSHLLYIIFSLYNSICLICLLLTFLYIN